jgi:Zn-finger nucleic acid-binding protein
MVPLPYEAVSVLLCPKCHGFLVTKTALNSIEKNPEMKESVLKAETGDMSDTVGTIRCPKCHISMKKKPAPHALKFTIDVCESCSLIWLDHGELEALQIAFEKSPAGREMLQRRKEMNEMSDERKEMLVANIAKAPDRLPNPVDHGELNIIGTRRRYRRYSILSSIIDSVFKL